jgi:sugar (pentulose or hexulose) kinase
LDKVKLPRIIDSSAIIGEVLDGPAKEFGLAPGTLIAAGAGDTAANALGAGIVHPGMRFDVAGTSFQGCGTRWLILVEVALLYAGSATNFLTMPEEKASQFQRKTCIRK